jgi:hypothetical protein
MPGHFTHIYIARRVADHLLTGHFPDWPQAGSALLKHDPVACGTAMKKWEKFTAIGAIGPTCFTSLRITTVFRWDRPAMN